ncbi:MAG: hypothetical protein U9Q34_02900 [Elusimicrobiota bacterium]|nr:hypothetical protein [Elusimicrobiota bacterium]
MSIKKIIKLKYFIYLLIATPIFLSVSCRREIKFVFSNPCLVFSKIIGMFDKTNYMNCQKLNIGITQKKVVDIMGKPDEVNLWEYGTLGGKKYLTYFNPSIMAGPNMIFIDTETSKVVLIRCSDIEIK